MLICPGRKRPGFWAGPASAGNIGRRDGVSKLATFVCSPLQAQLGHQLAVSQSKVESISSSAATFSFTPGSAVELLCLQFAIEASYNFKLSIILGSNLAAILS